ncbi:MAG TPA: hypothetical protein VK663_00110 [Burkholderiales bacterium]|nr:hypothetical protein [Burkholderiales bacterium]
MTLPDPRQWHRPAAPSALHALAEASLRGDVSARATLRLELDALIETGNDTEVDALLREASSADCYRHIQQVVAKLINKPERGESVIARLFAIPLVVVAGAKKALQVPEAIPDIAAISALLTEHGVLGTGRNFGVGNALCSMETLDCLPPSLLRQWAAQLRTGAAPLELAGSAIAVAPGREQVYLRFLVGASVVPAHVPSVTETGSNVGAWGMPFTQLLARQLAQPGLDILPIPRAPAALYLAADAGRAAQIELAFSLFLSNAARQFRMAVGDPAVVVSAHRTDDGSAELRVSLSSAFDESMLEGFRWPLYPNDDFSEIFNKINNLIKDCRLNDVLALPSVVADLNARGGRFLTARDMEQLASAPYAH